MTIPYKLTSLSNGEPPFEGFCELSLEEDVALQQYFAECQVLAAIKPIQENIRCRIHVHSGVGQPLTFQVAMPPKDDISMLLHALRPFILQTELYSFVKVKKIIGRRVAHPAIRTLMQNQQELYDGRAFQKDIRIETNEVLLNSDKALDDWLNSYEYHKDPEKRKSIDSIFERLPSEFVRGVFVNLLIEKVRSILNVMLVVKCLIGKLEMLDFEVDGEKWLLANCRVPGDSLISIPRS